MGCISPIITTVWYCLFEEVQDKSEGEQFVIPDRMATNLISVLAYFRHALQIKCLKKKKENTWVFMVIALEQDWNYLHSGISHKPQRCPTKMNQPKQ